jgi:surface antigen
MVVISVENEPNNNEPVEELDAPEESLNQEPEMLDEEMPEEQYDDYEKRFGQKEFEKTLGNKDYYKEEAEKLRKRREEAEEERDRDWIYDDDDRYNQKQDRDLYDENKSDDKDNSSGDRDESDKNSSDDDSSSKDDKDEDKKDVDENEDSSSDDDSSKKNDDQNKSKEESEKSEESEESNEGGETSGKNNNGKDDKKKGNKKDQNNKDGNQDGENKERKKLQKTDKDKKQDAKAVAAAKLAEKTNKINDVKNKAYQTTHPVAAAKAKLKSFLRKKMLALMTNPYFWLVVLIILTIFVVVVSICAMMGVFGDQEGGEDSYSSSGTLCTSSSEGDLLSFIEGWEGHTDYCQTISSTQGYLAVDCVKTPNGCIKDGTITAGAGVSNHVMGNASVTTLIEQNNWQAYFGKNAGGTYFLRLGDCIPTDVMDKIKLVVMENDFRASIEMAAERNEVPLSQFQIDAMTSYQYNTGCSPDDLVLSYKDGGYEGFWNFIKGTIYTATGAQLEGLKSRRKGEFALFVTGDYTDQGKFFNRTNENYDDYDSEDVMSRKASCYLDGGANGQGITIVDNYPARMVRPDRSDSHYYVQDANQYGNPGLEGECAWYAKYRAIELLEMTGSSKTWNSYTNGNAYCYVSEVQNGTFSTSTDYKSPMPGALISWSHGQYGHVAVVEAVEEDGIIISEMGIGYGYYRQELGWTAEQTWHYFAQGNESEKRKVNCEKNGSGCFHSGKLSWDQVQHVWPGYSFICYVYLLGE